MNNNNLRNVCTGMYYHSFYLLFEIYIENRYYYENNFYYALKLDVFFRCRKVYSTIIDIYYNAIRINTSNAYYARFDVVKR
jgi:hypothetical protein